MELSKFEMPCDIREFLSNRRVLLQLSGGKDSCALLLLLVRAKVNVEAVHFVHRFASGIPREMARKLCRQHNIPLHEFEITAELVKKLEAQPYDRPCRYCKAIMDGQTIRFAVEYGFDCIAVGDTGDDTALVNRLPDRGSSAIGNYLNGSLVVPSSIAIVRPLLKWNSADVFKFLMIENCHVERIGDTGDKYDEYSREGCSLQFKDYGANYSVDIMNRLFYYNELCSSYARGRGFRASVHLPGGSIVTIPAGHEAELRRYLEEEGCALPELPIIEEGAFCYMVSVPMLPVVEDLSCLECARKRLGERLEVPQNAIFLHLACKGKFLLVVIDSGHKIEESILRAVGVEIFHTRMLAVERLTHGAKKALWVFPQEARARYKTLLAIRLLSVFGNECVDVLLRQGIMSVLFVGERKIYEHIEESLRGVEVGFSERISDCSDDCHPMSVSSLMEAVLLAKLTEYCRDRNVQMMIFNEAHSCELAALTCRERFAFESASEKPSRRDVRLVDEYVYTMAETIDTHSINVNEGIRRTIPALPGSESRRSVHVFGNCVAFGLCVDDGDTIASLMQSMLVNTSGVRVVNHGAPAGRFPLNTLYRALAEPVQSGDVIVLMDWFDDDLIKGRDDVYNLHELYEESKTNEDEWFCDGELHLNAVGNAYIAKQIAARICERNKTDILDCNAFSYFGNSIDMSKREEVLSPYIRHVARFHEAKKADGVPLYYPPSKIDAPVPLRRTEYVNSIVARYAPYLQPICTQATGYRKKRAIRLVLHREISETVLYEIRLKLGEFGTLVDVNDQGAAVVHYGMNGCLGTVPSFHFFIDSPDDVNEILGKELNRFFELTANKVLLYLGKFPSGGTDVDGGSQMAGQLIDTLREFCDLDVTFIRKTEREFFAPGIHSVRYVKYLDPRGDKFQRRIENIGSNRVAIINGSRYNLVVAAHCSKLFGLADEEELMSKTVLFPMFLSDAYRRSGEMVPDNYVREERKVLERVSLIITPSDDEKKDILSSTVARSDRICVIPRGVDPQIAYSDHSGVGVELISIASIKRQKNHAGELRVLRELRQRGTDARLTIVGEIYDLDEWSLLQRHVADWGLAGHVEWLSGLTRSQVRELLKRMKIGLSTSRWETFGRGIFECLASGVPMVLSNSIDTVAARLKGTPSAIFCADEISMADAVESLIKDGERYRRLSLAAAEIAEKYSSAVESERLVYALIAERNHYKTRFTNWRLGDCDCIYSGRYSECWRNGDSVRKYIWFDNREKVEREFKTAKAAWAIGVTTPRPSFCARDVLCDRWFIEFAMYPSVPIEHWCENDFLLALRNIEKFQNAVVPDLWDEMVEDLTKNLTEFGELFASDVARDIECIRSTKPTCAVHGDFTPRNMRHSAASDDIVVFDFQCSTMGPAAWDISYLLANFKPETLPSVILGEVDLDFVCIVLKVRIVRAVRKNEPTADMQELLKAWKGWNKCV